MKKGKILLLVVLSPFLLLIFICGSKYFDPSVDKIHALIPQRAATQSQAVAWLKSENRMRTPRPISQEEMMTLKGFDAYAWRNGVVPKDIQTAASVIFTDFDIRPRRLSNSWARNVMQCYLYFDADGKLIASRSETICFGF